MSEQPQARGRRCGNRMGLFPGLGALNRMERELPEIKEAIARFEENRALERKVLRLYYREKNSSRTIRDLLRDEGVVMTHKQILRIVALGE